MPRKPKIDMDEKFSLPPDTELDDVLRALLLVKPDDGSEKESEDQATKRR
jgi:hypothetical protein